MQLLADPTADSYFQDNIFTNVPVPPELVKSTAAAPPAANGQAASAGVIRFSDWLQTHMPEIYQSVVLTLPEAFVPEFALAGMPKLGWRRGNRDTLQGVGDGVSFSFDTPGAVTNPDIGATGVTATPTTDWGTKILDSINQILPAWAQYQGQRDLIQLNIARAEKNLPPISASDIAPQVNVGVSPQLQQLGTIAVFGLIGVGLLAAFRKAGK